MKRAAVDVQPDALAECVGIFADHGLELVGSLPSRAPYPSVRLVYHGDALPDECGVCDWGVMPLITATVQTEACGRQRIHRVADIKVVELIDLRAELAAA